MNQQVYDRQLDNTGGISSSQKHLRLRTDIRRQSQIISGKWIQMKLECKCYKRKFFIHVHKASIFVKENINVLNSMIHRHWDSLITLISLSVGTSIAC